MTTIKTQNGISITSNGKSTFMVVSLQEFETSDVIHGCVSSLRKAENLLKKVLKWEGKI